MSDSWINLIPSDPRFVPSAEAQVKALSLLRQFVGGADEVRIELTDQVRFVDCGENFEAIRCPRCRREIPVDWWQDQMDVQFGAGFPLDPVELPCCSGSASLSSLEYDWPQGFARFSIEAMNPSVSDLSGEQVMAIEGILGCRIIKILQHV